MIGLRGRGSIDPVRVLLDLPISASRDCIETRDIAQLQLNQVREKLAALRSLEHRLEFKDMASPAKAGGCCG
ncbi:MerR family DNA-binding protein [Mesorhizobium huakuii]|uniref:Transcription regulator MerR DNA binding domain-containing protein n=1 Tax=Mesorhizobium huakuii TaxID=28104 RepID=A0A7G6T171_9HYPH|nr:MerR family DNA-binding protein [Mesorhizobium huakuii]QND60503.1 hypothetical protein HB778_31135 [Mesorhizobium huakuii]